MPQVTSLTQVPPGCATSLYEIRRIDFSQLGIVFTDRGIFPQYVAAPTSEQPARRRGIVTAGLSCPSKQPMPLHVLTGNPAQRNGRTSVTTHLLRGAVPSGSFYRVSDSLLVASPELTYLHSCMNNRILPNIELALEWCGTYALRANGQSCKFDIKPLTSVKALQVFIEKIRYPRGGPAARAALKWAQDGMASPRESELFLIVVLPADQGGYAFPIPLVNAKIPLDGTDSSSLSDSEFYRADLLWKEKRVILEYDGHEDHEVNPEQIVADKERRSVLAVLGYQVIVVTKRDLQNAKLLERKMTQLALALGIHIPYRDEARWSTHHALFSWLCNPAHEHLPFWCEYR